MTHLCWRLNQPSKQIRLRKACSDPETLLVQHSMIVACKPRCKLQCAIYTQLLAGQSWPSRVIPAWDPHHAGNSALECLIQWFSLWSHFSCFTWQWLSLWSRLLSLHCRVDYRNVTMSWTSDCHNHLLLVLQTTVVIVDILWSCFIRATVPWKIMHFSQPI